MVCKINKYYYNNFFFFVHCTCILSCLNLLCLWSQNLESVKEGPCRECQCQEGHVICYQHSCPTCPLGTLTIPHREQCCPDCNPGETCIYVSVHLPNSNDELQATVVNYNALLWICSNQISEIGVILWIRERKFNVFTSKEHYIIIYSQFNSISLYN